MTTIPDPETALRDAGYLDDRKFTDGVLAALPPRTARPRTAVLLAAGAAAGLLGAVTLGEPVVEAALVLGGSGVAGMLLAGAVMVLAAGTLLKSSR
jgi:hypothetical protein